MTESLKQLREAIARLSELAQSSELPYWVQDDIASDVARLQTLADRLEKEAA